MRANICYKICLKKNKWKCFRQCLNSFRSPECFNKGDVDTHNVDTTQNYSLEDCKTYWQPAAISSRRVRSMLSIFKQPQNDNNWIGFWLGNVEIGKHHKSIIKKKHCNEIQPISLSLLHAALKYADVVLMCAGNEVTLTFWQLTHNNKIQTSRRTLHNLLLIKSSQSLLVCINILKMVEETAQDYTNYLDQLNFPKEVISRPYKNQCHQCTRSW